MAFEGYVDVANPTEIRGWVFDDARPTTPLRVEILGAEGVIATLLADQYRGDLAAAGKGDGYHGYSYRVGVHGSTAPIGARLEGRRWNLVPAGGMLPVSIRFDRRLAHTLEFGLPKVDGDFSKASPSPEESEVVQRIIAAYHRAMEDDPYRKAKKADMWSEMASAFHKEVVELLEKRDVAKLSNYLRDAHAKGLTHGITQGEQTTAVLRLRADAREQVLIQHIDKLVSLAEFLGVLDVESPEQHGQWAENLHSDPDELIDKIEALVGIPLVPPQVMGSHFGIKTRGGILTSRDIISFYAALRIQGIARDSGLASPAVCEIGAGLGGGAFYAARMGVGPYTVIDLPLVNVLQSYFLMRALPESKVSLYGENHDGAAITLLPTFCFDQPDRQYDLLVNQDSFPEMHADFALGYLRQSHKNVRHGFLSFNQEARAAQSGSTRQNVVRDLVKQTGGYRMVSRFRHWLWAGYVEEWYRKE